MRILPFVSIIVPCRNEESYISKVIYNILQQDYPKEYLEIFIVDGLSSDRTAQIIKEFALQYPFISYLSNPEKTVPYALNKAIAVSKGEVVVRMDAHAEYPVNYVSKLVESLFVLNADNVGGLWNTLPGDDGLIAKSIALGMSSSFGVGNAYYRIGISTPKEVDTVPFGCYRRGVFEKIGLFDEELTRNQDDEFNGRLIESGGKIFLIPEIEILYFARKTWGKMCKMFFQYGLFKPLVNRKLKKPATLRQFVPLGFLCLLLWTFFSAFVWIHGFYLGLIFIALYLVMNISVSIRNAIKQRNISLIGTLPPTFILIHLSYGFGYFLGLLKYFVFRQRAGKVALSR